jgi:hypothetical protein
MFVIPISLATALSWMVVPAIILGALMLLLATITGIGKVRSRTPAQIMALNRHSRPSRVPPWIVPTLVLAFFPCLIGLVAVLH